MNRKSINTPLRQDLLMAYLAAAAVGTHILEASLPGIGPWFKPGLANTFTMVAFFHLGWKAAFTVATIRVLASSLALGTFLSPTFFLSFFGSMGAVLILGIIRWIWLCNESQSKKTLLKTNQPTRPQTHKHISLSYSHKVSMATYRHNGPGPVGVSLLAALAHMMFQVTTAWFLIIGHAGIFLALPWLLVGSWLTGVSNGILAFLILERLANFEILAERIHESVE